MTDAHKIRQSQEQEALQYARSARNKERNRAHSTVDKDKTDHNRLLCDILLLTVRVTWQNEHGAVWATSGGRVFSRRGDYQVSDCR